MGSSDKGGMDWVFNIERNRFCVFAGVERVLACTFPQNFV
jgi:hypothetical protein